MCSLHFEDGAPTQAQPYPSQAGSTASTVSQISRLLKFYRIFVCLFIYAHNLTMTLGTGSARRILSNNEMLHYTI